MTDDPNAPLSCPACNVSLLGDPIPEEILYMYSGTHWKRETGQYDLYLDRTVSLKCPDCGHLWPR